MKGTHSKGIVDLSDRPQCRHIPPPYECCWRLTKSRDKLKSEERHELAQEMFSEPQPAVLWALVTNKRGQISVQVEGNNEPPLSKKPKVRVMRSTHLVMGWRPGCCRGGDHGRHKQTHRIDGPAITPRQPPEKSMPPPHAPA